MPQFDVITFDCYGTLIDWETGIARAFLDEAAHDGVTLSSEEVIAAYEAVEPVVERERYRRYRDVLTETASGVAARLGWQLPRERAAFLASSLPSWTPFADTNPSLERLHRSGIRLGILSNVDRDLLAETRKHFTVDFELIITAEDVGSYKPAKNHFTTARASIGGARWLHAAQSNFHDIVPTNELGVPNAWINRRNDRALPGGVPTYEFEDLDSFAAAMT
jgi:2-haloalkanoic acid dehalogenase type II